MQVAKFNWNGGFVLEGGNTGGVVIGAGSNATNVSWTSVLLISKIVVKGGTHAGIVDVNPPATSGSFDNVIIPLNNGGQRPAISNVKFCSPTGSSSSVELFDPVELFELFEPVELFELLQLFDSVEHLQALRALRASVDALQARRARRALSSSPSSDARRAP